MALVISGPVVAADTVSITTSALLSVNGTIAVAEGPGSLLLTADTIVIGGGVALQATTIQIRSATSTTVNDGVTMKTGGGVFVRPATGVAPDDPGKNVNVSAGDNISSPGAHFYVGAAGFHQIGLLTVMSDGTVSSPKATSWLDFVLTGGTGQIDLDPPSPQGVSAPNTTIFLHLGTAGYATGVINADALAIYYSSPGARPTILTATLRTLQGVPVSDSSAASQAYISFNGVYIPSNQFQVNGCAVSSVNCVLVSSVQQVPILNPFKDIEIGRITDRFDDPELLLPNVSDLDSCRRLQPGLLKCAD